MIDIGAGVADIINNPANRGIGAGINQNIKSVKQVTRSWKKQTSIVQEKPYQQNTIKSVLNNAVKNTVKATGTAVSETVNTAIKNTAGAIKEDTLGEMMRTLITGNRQANTIASLAEMTMKKSIDELLQDQIKKGKLSLQTSQLGKTYATAKAYYKKLYDADKMMMDLRNNTEKNITSIINKGINDKLAAWQKGLPKWQRNILANSKLASSLQTYIKNATANCIKGIFGDSVIKNWNTKLLDNLKRLKTSIQDQFNKTFKGGIEYYQKLKQAIADKIKLYQEMKTRFEKHITSVINDYKKKISDAIQSFTKKLVSSIGDSIKSLASGIKL